VIGMIIAEVGGNHDGNIGIAFELIEQAALCGADAVKFQSYEAEKLVHPTAEALPQAKGYTKQVDRFKDLEFTWDEWQQIITCCKKNNIEFMTSCFDIVTLQKFLPYLKRVKIASGDLTFDRYLRFIALQERPVILSTGMSDYQEIEKAASLFKYKDLTVMHCVSLYPTPPEHANLGVLRELSKKYRVGYSDHSEGTLACVLALAAGAEVIEKHFTLDSSLDYGDHPLSAEPEDLRDLVEMAKTVKEMFGTDKPDPKEDRVKMRRGYYAKKPVRFGQIITENDFIELRPAINTNPIGKRARKDYEPLEPF